MTFLRTQHSALWLRRAMLVTALIAAGACQRPNSSVRTFAARGCPSGWRLLYVEHVDGGSADRAVCRERSASDSLRMSAGSLNRP